MTVWDHDRGYLSVHPWARIRASAARRNHEGSALGFFVFWLAFFALVGAVNYVLGLVF